MPIPWPVYEPRRVRDTSLELLVTKLVRQDKPVTSAQMAGAVHRIYGWFDVPGPVRDRFQRFLDVINTIDAIKQRVLGAGDRSVISNMLAVSLGRLYAVRLPADVVYMRELERLVASLQRSHDHSWFYPKVMAFYQAYILHNYSVRLVRQSMPADDEAAKQLAGLGIKDGEKAVAEIAAELAGHRAYGVKTCLFQDGILHKNEDAWVFNDGYDFMRNAPTAELGLELAQPLAVVTLASRREIDRLEPTTRNYQQTNAAFTGVAFSFQSKLMTAIHASGEFTEDVEIGVASLRECFEQADRTVAYTLFRIVNLMRLYNLIVPQYVAPGLAVPAWPVLPKGRREREEHQQKLKEGLRDLVIPRLRVLRDPAAVRAALQREVMQAASDTESLTRKAVSRHEVTGFVRMLPPGCTATTQARQLAWQERGIVLAENQTYVRSHRRGQGPDLTPGHVARTRR